MPSLMASIGLDATQFKAGLDSAAAQARSAGDRIMASLNPSRSTITNPARAASKEAEYAGWWGTTLAVRRQNETDAAVEKASRDNRARALRRERAERETARKQEAYAASMAGRTSTAVTSALSSSLGPMVIGAAALGGLERMVQDTMEYADNIQELSFRLGIGEDRLMKWDFALTQNGSSLEKGVRFFENLAVAKEKALAGDDKMIADLAAMNIQLAELQSMSPDQMAMRIQQTYSAGDPRKLGPILGRLGGKKAAMEVGGAMRSPDFQENFDNAPTYRVDEMAEAIDKLKALWQEARPTVAAVMTMLIDQTTRYIQVLKDAAVVSGAFLSGFAKGGIAGGVTGALEAHGKRLENRALAQKAKDDERINRELGLYQDGGGPGSAGMKGGGSENKKNWMEDLFNDIKKEQNAEEKARDRNELRTLKDKRQKLLAGQRELGSGLPELNQLQRIGAYSQAPEIMVAQRQRDTTNTLLKSIDAKIGKLEGRTEESTQF